MKTAININTQVWKNIILCLIKDNWVVIEKYMAFDAGIDFDFLILKKGNDRIVFGWDNYEQGEIKCKDEIFEYLSGEFNINLVFGRPKNLTWKIILITRALTIPQRYLSNPSKNFHDFFD
ncbi:hypothetical protein [Marinigracilibium pacificum]|uniref:Uncharacterized protein n=1 Tax=Marinigracilibium pacificum TaxID=2729599 RepID=A0A848J3P9_9BACT|nr:hypothetical protein [Marinigracilibium pacificum]NMM47802.1 hypothetical protein [Marinigracilibium pacificum]